MYQNKLLFLLPIGITPLHYAAKKGYSNIFKMIFDEIKDKSPKDNCELTPLHNAAQNGHEEICNMLLGKVENKNPKDINGKSKF